MTISTTTNRKEYTGNGVTTIFSFPYRFLQDSDVKVYLSGVLQVRDTDYTLTGAGGSSGGDVTFITAPPDPTPLTKNVVIVRDPDITQDTDWVENDPDPAAQKEDAFDKLTIISQRLRELISRSVVLSDSDISGLDLTLPTPIANKLLAIASTGTELTLADFVDNVFVNQEAEPATDGSLFLWQKTSTGILYYLLSSVWTPVADSTALLASTNTWTGLNTYQKFQMWYKGSDIASAATLLHGIGGNYFDVTGTTTITEIDVSGMSTGAVPQGATIKLHFDAALTLTHNVAKIILPGGANITTAAGDEAEFVNVGTKIWRCTNYTRANGKALVETVPDTITQGTLTATTAGTSIDITGIPSGVKRISLHFSGVSTDGTSAWLVQLGDSGGVEATGYNGSGSLIGTASAASTAYTTGFGLKSSASTYVMHGTIILSLVDAATFLWAATGALGRSSTETILITGGTKALTAELDRIRLTTVGGTDNFDAGSINIQYEI